MRPRDPEKLTAREQFFIQAYLGEARGNGAAAARLAGYAPATADREASRVLKRPRVQAAIRAQTERAAAEVGLTKEALLKRAQEILGGPNPFASLKAAELVARLLGYFAPTRSIHETVSHQGEKAVGYEELARTLKGHGADFPTDSLAAMREDLLKTDEALHQCLGTIDSLLAARAAARH